MKIDEIEARRLIIQAALDQQKTQEERNRLGQFATPPALAYDILTHAKSLMPAGARIRFLDPALGSGAFYAALKRVFPPTVIDAADAFEIDPHYGLPAQELWGRCGLGLTQGDFTDATPHPSHNLLICNPPYVRHHHLTANEKARLGGRTALLSGYKLSGLAGLYAHFLLQAHAWMEPGAVAGWLIPSEFMDVNYGCELRRYLSEKVTLLQIHRFSPNDVQFADALVSSAVVWVKKEPPPPHHTVLFTQGGSLAKPDISRDVELDELAVEPKWTRFPEHGVRVQGRDALQRIGDLFSIKRGLATGNNRFFVLNEQQVAEHELSRDVLRPILPSPRYVKVDEVLADLDGLPSNVDRLYLLDPRMDEESIRSRYSTVATYLDEGKKHGVHEGYLCRGRRRWYDQERREPAPIICTYMGRSDSKKERPFRFIRNRSRATVANVYLAMYPKPPFARLLKSNPDLLDQVWHHLNEISPDVLLGEGRVYGGGLYKLEPKELSKVPVDIPMLQSLRSPRTEQFSIEFDCPIAERA